MYNVLVIISDGSDTQNPGFWQPHCCQEMGLRQVGQGFFLFFCQSFAIFDDFSKWSALKVLGDFENH